VREDGGYADGRECETVVHGTGGDGGKWRRGSQTSKLGVVVLGSRAKAVGTAR
jgi:hypothetical protein